MDLVITQEEKERLKEIFRDVPSGAKVLIFTQSINCPTCPSMEKLVDALEEASGGKVKFERYNFVQDKEIAEKYGVKMAPAMVFTDESGTNYGIIFYGLPIGYEFITLIEMFKMIPTKAHNLSKKTMDFLNSLTQDLEIKVFVTPSCPYCPQAAILSYKLAMASPKVKSCVIEAMEFEDMAISYNVVGVPKIVINDMIEIEGAMPEPYFIEHVKRQLQKIITPR